MRKLSFAFFSLLCFEVSASFGVQDVTEFFTLFKDSLEGWLKGSPQEAVLKVRRGRHV